MYFYIIVNNYLSSSLLFGAIGTGHIDKIIIVPLLGFTLLGNYSLGLQMIGVMMMFTNVFYKYVLTQDASNIDVKNLKILAVIISILLAFLGMFLGPIFIDLYFPKYVDTKIAIQLQDNKVQIAYDHQQMMTVKGLLMACLWEILEETDKEGHPLDKFTGLLNFNVNHADYRN